MEENIKVRIFRDLKRKIGSETDQLEQKKRLKEYEIEFFKTYCKMCDKYHESDSHINCEELFYPNGIPDTHKLEKEIAEIDKRLFYISNHLLPSVDELEEVTLVSE